MQAEPISRELVVVSGIAAAFVHQELLYFFYERFARDMMEIHGS